MNVLQIWNRMSNIILFVKGNTRTPELENVFLL